MIEHRSGRSHVAPDSLSRLPARAPVAADEELEPPVLVVDVPVEPPPTQARGRPMLELVKPFPAVTHKMLYDEQAWTRGAGILLRESRPDWTATRGRRRAC